MKRCSNQRLAWTPRRHFLPYRCGGRGIGIKGLARQVWLTPTFGKWRWYGHKDTFPSCHFECGFYTTHYLENVNITHYLDERDDWTKANLASFINVVDYREKVVSSTCIQREGWVTPNIGRDNLGQKDYVAAYTLSSFLRL